MHDTVTNPERLTVPTGEGGYYAIHCTLEYYATAASLNIVFQLRKNGSGMYGSLDYEQMTESHEQSIHLHAMDNLSAGDYITCIISGDAGGSGQTIYVRGVFSMFKIGT